MIEKESYTSDYRIDYVYKIQQIKEEVIEKM